MHEADAGLFVSDEPQEFSFEFGLDSRYPFYFSSDQTIDDAKVAVADAAGFAPEDLEMFCNGARLPDEALLFQIGYTASSPIQVALKPDSIIVYEDRGLCQRKRGKFRRQLPVTVAELEHDYRQKFRIDPERQDRIHFVWRGTTLAADRELHVSDGWGTFHFYAVLSRQKLCDSGWNSMMISRCVTLHRLGGDEEFRVQREPGMTVKDLRRIILEKTPDLASDSLIEVSRSGDSLKDDDKVWLGDYTWRLQSQRGSRERISLHRSDGA
jgi:hypothetical protein